ncbi:Nucleotidyl transferase [Chryseolinea serpens]|uniref:Nucleotidyl transferase n=1 Tax=Chryseolinea serpens TaxID=947013 RepID=A0A1M5KYI0_9BACT|nr:sugar phosphate nucleotidyltransferase [Chryseolinea serpens]SHG57796.1 Nucleotidyl transferase [Chryseolinea serpens]
MNTGDYLISETATLLGCLQQLNKLKRDLNLFVVNAEGKLLGSVTDGDIRRGILRGTGLDDSVQHVMNASCKYLVKDKIDLHLIKEQRNKAIKILPIVDQQMRVIDLLSFDKVSTALPIDAVIMAGGKGTRLLPLTQKTPKPLLAIGDKPIIAYNLERIMRFGIKNIFITVNYLKEQIYDFVKSDKAFDTVRCIEEHQALGTIGALSLIQEWQNEYVLLTNSDLLTNIDYEDFFFDFLQSGSDMMVAAISYPIQVPYAILETQGKAIKSFKEKPDYTYQANTGIYLIKRQLLKYIPSNGFFNATDFMDTLLEKGHSISYYQLVGYWLDIGKHEDFKKAQEDIKHLRF